MNVVDQLSALDARVFRRWPGLLDDSLRARARVIIVFQGLAMLFLFVGLATDSPTVIGLVGPAVGGTLGLAIRLLRKPPRA